MIRWCPLLAVACGPTFLTPGARPTPGDHHPHRSDPDTLARLGADPRLRIFHRDVLLRCDDADTAHAPPACDLATLGDGVESPLDTPAVVAWRFDHRLLVLDGQLALTLVDPATGDVEPVASGAIDPRVADDGRRITFARLGDDRTTFTPGDAFTLVLRDLVDGTERVVSPDGPASGAFTVPGSDEVLFVSGRTGLASLWLDDGSGASVQLTNVGLGSAADPAFVPVPGREGVWMDRTLVYTATYHGLHELWQIDVDSGEAGRIGPGRLPALVDRDALLAVSDDFVNVPLEVRNYGGAR
jgi:hypothetical protein